MKKFDWYGHRTATGANSTIPGVVAVAFCIFGGKLETCLTFSISWKYRQSRWNWQQCPLNKLESLSVSAMNVWMWWNLQSTFSWLFAVQFWAFANSVLSHCLDGEISRYEWEEDVATDKVYMDGQSMGEHWDLHFRTLFKFCVIYVSHW